MSLSFSDLLLSARTDVILCSLIKLDCSTLLRFPPARFSHFHLVVRGQVVLKLEGEDEATHLGPGDFALMIRGDGHDICVPGASHAKIFSGLRHLTRVEEPPVATFGGGGSATLLSGRYGLDHLRDDTVSAQTPDIMLCRAADPGASGPFLSLGDADAFERECRGPGARAFVASVVRLLHIRTMRGALRMVNADSSVDLDRLGIPQIAIARRLIESNLSGRWTLTGLARTVGLSRSVFAERFLDIVGEPPMRHIARLRMEKSATLLAAGATVGDAAVQVGYSEASTFGRAFRRHFGHAPRTHARLNRLRGR